MDGIGKLTNEELKSIILSGITPNRGDVLLRPGVGVDCGAIRTGGRVCVFSSDPITAAAADAGRLAVHVSANDVAAAGAEPVGLLLTILAPPGTPPARLTELVAQAQEESARLHIEILGGHTEYTDAVTRVVLSSTAIGLAPDNGRVFSAMGARPGDELVLSKWAGLEGTAILASDYPEQVGQWLTSEELAFARSLADKISVVPEGRIASQLSVTAMHDVTEGGVLGAAWEMAEASGCGIRLERERIPVLAVTRKLCEGAGLDPYRLISSGCLLMAAVNGRQIVRSLVAKGIEAAVIGTFVEGPSVLRVGEQEQPLAPRAADELYRFLRGKG